MDSQSICNHKGFTLIEMLVATCVLLLLFGAGAMLTLSNYRARSFDRDVQEAITLLQAARSKAMHNIDQTPQGVEVGDQEIVFLQLSGDTAAHMIMLTDETRGVSKIISINAEGRISW